MKRQKANSLKNITWSELWKQNIKAKKVYSIIKLDRGHAGMKFTRDTSQPQQFALIQKKKTRMKSWKNHYTWRWKWQEVRKFSRSTQACFKSHENRSLMLRINENHCQIAKKKAALNENLPTLRIDSPFVVQFNKSYFRRQGLFFCLQ